MSDGRVAYSDGTPTTTDQEARDVVTFLYWTSNPETTERKAMGVRVVLFLILLVVAQAGSNQAQVIHFRFVVRSLALRLHVAG